ncbi:unnamed protein product [Owenia fusiformis]|uniref:Uncharacterized protein n=1 Tax=Owenia fusiformis TaxID=6347 RepID=A0A8J1T608_OWEFU|nr:unnamed protein product [Owenia fusiformis]
MEEDLIPAKCIETHGGTRHATIKTTSDVYETIAGAPKPMQNMYGVQDQRTSSYQAPPGFRSHNPSGLVHTDMVHVDQNKDGHKHSVSTEHIALSGSGQSSLNKSGSSPPGFRATRTRGGKQRMDSSRGMHKTVDTIADVEAIEPNTNENMEQIQDNKAVHFPSAYKDSEESGKRVPPLTPRELLEQHKKGSSHPPGMLFRSGKPKHVPIHPKILESCQGNKDAVDTCAAMDEGFDDTPKKKHIIPLKIKTSPLDEKYPHEIGTPGIQILTPNTFHKMVEYRPPTPHDDMLSPRYPDAMETETSIINLKLPTVMTTGPIKSTSYQAPNPKSFTSKFSDSPLSDSKAPLAHLLHQQTVYAHGIGRGRGAFSPHHFLKSPETGEISPNHPINGDSRTVLIQSSSPSQNKALVIEANADNTSLQEPKDLNFDESYDQWRNPVKEEPISSPETCAPSRPPGFAFSSPRVLIPKSKSDVILFKADSDFRCETGVAAKTKYDDMSTAKDTKDKDDSLSDTDGVLLCHRDITQRNTRTQDLKKQYEKSLEQINKKHEENLQKLDEDQKKLEEDHKKLLDKEHKKLNGDHRKVEYHHHRRLEVDKDHRKLADEDHKILVDEDQRNEDHRHIDKHPRNVFDKGKDKDHQQVHRYHRKLLAEKHRKLLDEDQRELIDEDHRNIIDEDPKNQMSKHDNNGNKECKQTPRIETKKEISRKSPCTPVVQYWGKVSNHTSSPVVVTDDNVPNDKTMNFMEEIKILESTLQSKPKDAKQKEGAFDFMEGVELIHKLLSPEKCANSNEQLVCANPDPLDTHLSPITSYSSQENLNWDVLKKEFESESSQTRMKEANKAKLSSHPAMYQNHQTVKQRQKDETGGRSFILTRGKSGRPHSQGTPNKRIKCSSSPLKSVRTPLPTKKTESFTSVVTDKCDLANIEQSHKKNLNDELNQSSHGTKVDQHHHDPYIQHKPAPMVNKGHEKHPKYQLRDRPERFGTNTHVTSRSHVRQSYPPPLLGQCFNRPYAPPYPGQHSFPRQSPSFLPNYQQGNSQSRMPQYRYPNIDIPRHKVIEIKKFPQCYDLNNSEDWEEELSEDTDAEETRHATITYQNQLKGQGNYPMDNEEAEYDSDKLSESDKSQVSSKIKIYDYRHNSFDEDSNKRHGVPESYCQNDIKMEEEKFKICQKRPNSQCAKSSLEEGEINESEEEVNYRDNQSEIEAETKTFREPLKFFSGYDGTQNFNESRKCLPRPHFKSSDEDEYEEIHQTNQMSRLGCEKIDEAHCKIGRGRTYAEAIGVKYSGPRLPLQTDQTVQGRYSSPAFPKPFMGRGVRRPVSVLYPSARYPVYPRMPTGGRMHTPGGYPAYRTQHTPSKEEIEGKWANDDREENMEISSTNVTSKKAVPDWYEEPDHAGEGYVTKWPAPGEHLQCLPPHIRKSYIQQQAAKNSAGHKVPELDVDRSPSLRKPPYLSRAGPTGASPGRPSLGSWRNDQAWNSLGREMSDVPQYGQIPNEISWRQNNQFRDQKYNDDIQTEAPTWKDRFKHNFGNITAKYIDSHCHIDFLFNQLRFKGSFERFINENKDMFPPCYEGCITVFCNPASFTPKGGLWKDILAAPNVWGTFGCHPKRATEYDKIAEDGLKMCMLEEKVVALGEIGLDYSGSFEQHKDVQKDVFIRQLEIALEMKMPLVLHCREAAEDMFQIMIEKVPRNHKIHLHCFTRDWPEAYKWINAFPNLFIGLTPLLTYKHVGALQEVARQIPLNKLLLETDAPYFLPHGVAKTDYEKSHPGFAIYTAKSVAYHKGIPIEDVLIACRENTRNMYGV